jgi:hypothetical protein
VLAVTIFLSQLPNVAASSPVGTGKNAGCPAGIASVCYVGGQGSFQCESAIFQAQSKLRHALQCHGQMTTLPVNF